MGSCCSSQSDATDDNFHSPGRTLGSNTQAPGQNTASAPSRKPTGPGRTTGSGGGNGPSDPLPPRDAAARAAEARARPSSKQGSLGKKLRAQQSESQNQLLAESARRNREGREVDGVEEARRWD